jgi:ribosome-associated translation inhibitor RaiA
MKTHATAFERIQAEYDAKLAELDRLIVENNAKLAAAHLSMHAAIADAQAAIDSAIEKLSK